MAPRITFRRPVSNLDEIANMLLDIADTEADHIFNEDGSVTVFFAPDEINLNHWFPGPSENTQTGHTPAAEPSQTSASPPATVDETHIPTVQSAETTSNGICEDATHIILHEWRLAEIAKFTEQFEEHKYQSRPLIARSDDRYESTGPMYFIYRTSAMPVAGTDVRERAHRFWRNYLLSKGLIPPSWVELCDQTSSDDGPVGVFFNLHIIILGLQGDD
ncbi:hypothetical protein TWF696_008082 [Orbilia brochopaga]|uniref:Uncharacterized protein n=1 Tax=Orbilia brochopaga TaxID=3140254 RepID=A0AAV9UPG7_9PEZI